MMTKRLALCSLLLVAAAFFVPATASAQDCYDIFLCWGVNCCDNEGYEKGEFLTISGPDECWACAEDPCQAHSGCAVAPVPEAEALAQLAWSDAVIEEVRVGGLALLLTAEVPPTQPKPLDVADWVAYQRATCPTMQASGNSPLMR